MNKYQLKCIYKERYIYVLNKIYEDNFNSVNNNLLLKEYNLLFEVMVNLVYENNDTWSINFGEGKYKKTLIYSLSKEYWSALSNLFEQLKKCC